MALVFCKPNLSNGIVGKFLDDGLEYFACWQTYHLIDLYLFPECSIKCKTINTVGYRYPVGDLASYKASKMQDYLVVAKEDTLTYWNGVEFLDLPSMFYNTPENTIMRTSSLCLDQEIGAPTECGSLFEKALGGFEFQSYDYFLDENTAIRFENISEDMYNLEVISLVSSQRISAGKLELISYGRFHPAVSYLSRDEKSKIIVFERDTKYHILDISHAEAHDISDQFTARLNTRDRYSFFIFHLFYDNETQLPVFCSKNIEFVRALYVFKADGIHRLELDCEVSLLNARLVCMGCNVYEIVINADTELELVFRSSLPLTGEVKHTCRDLAGIAYIGKNGIFRKTLAFTTTRVLSNESLEPVVAIFWVGHNSVLLSGHTRSIVVNVYTGDEVGSWYKSEYTLFACEKFQVCKSRVYTEDKELVLSLADASMFAQSGQNLIVSSRTEVVIMSQDLHIIQKFQEDVILSVFSEGYVVASGVKLFKTPETPLLLPNVVWAAYQNEDLHTLSTDGVVRCGKDQGKVDLMLECANSIQAIGNSILISGDNDDYLRLNDEYFSLAIGDYESALFSEKADVCVTLLNGVVYLKSNVGLRMVKKKVGGYLDYTEVSVFNDKLLCRKINVRAMESILIARKIAGGKPTLFRIPRKSGDFESFLFTNSHFLVLNERNGRFKLRVHSLEDPKTEIFEDDISMHSVYSIKFRLIPGFSDDSKIFISYEVDYNLNRKVYEWKNGKLVCCEHEQILDPIYAEILNPANALNLGHINEDDNSVYKLGLQASDYPKNGEHWVVLKSVSPREGISLSLIPKSTSSIELNVTQGSMIRRNARNLSSIRAEEDPNVYYCVFDNQVYKVTVGGPQERIDTISLYPYKTSANYATNHGLRVKYEPDFIISGATLITITILPPQLAKNLQAVQEEILRGLARPPVVSKIDGEFLLSASMNPRNESIFTSHGVNVNELKADLWAAFE